MNLSQQMYDIQVGLSINSRVTDSRQIDEIQDDMANRKTQIANILGITEDKVRLKVTEVDNNGY